MTFLHSHPIFSTLPNLTFLTSETQKFKFDKFLPFTLSPTQNKPKEPKRFQINPHLDHKTAVHIFLEEAACRCFDLARTNLAHLSPNRATHLKSPKNVLTPESGNMGVWSFQDGPEITRHQRPNGDNNVWSFWTPTCPYTHQSCRCKPVSHLFIHPCPLVQTLLVI